MQSLKWFFFRTKLRFIICFCIMFFVAAEANAQYKTVQYEVSQKETLYKIAKIYNTRVDSLMKWNNLSSSSIIPGQVITIHDYYKLQEEELEMNRLRYTLGSNETARNEDLSFVQLKLDSLQETKQNVDDNDPFAMVQYFDIAKLRKQYEDSLAVIQEKYDAKR